MKLYKPGTRVEVVSMNDEYSPLPPGTQGTVVDSHEVNLGPGPDRRFVQVLVDWDNGRNLMPCIPPDVIREVTR